MLVKEKAEVWCHPEEELAAPSEDFTHFLQLVRLSSYCRDWSWDNEDGWDHTLLRPSGLNFLSLILNSSFNPGTWGPFLTCLFLSSATLTDLFLLFTTVSCGHPEAEWPSLTC